MSFAACYSGVVKAFIFVVNVTDVTCTTGVVRGVVAGRGHVTFLVLPTAVVRGFMTQFLVIAMKVTTTVVITTSLTRVAHCLMLPLFGLPRTFRRSILCRLLSVTTVSKRRMFEKSKSTLGVSCRG